MAGISLSSEIISVLLKRAHLLEQIITRTTDRRVLAKEVDESRTTVYRGLDQLKDAGLVVESNGEYAATPYGHLVFRLFNGFNNTVEILHNAEEMLETVPEESVSLAPFFGANVFLPDRTSPAMIMERNESMIRNSSAIKGFTPTVFPGWVDSLHEEVADETIMAELIFEEDGINVLQENYATQFNQVLSSGIVHLLKTTDRLPFGLLVATEPDAKMQLISHDSYGNLRGIIENDTSIAVDWAESAYRRYHVDAETVGMTRSASLYNESPISPS